MGCVTPSIPLSSLSLSLFMGQRRIKLTLHRCVEKEKERQRQRDRDKPKMESFAPTAVNQNLITVSTYSRNVISYQYEISSSVLVISSL